jgi:hypothetical protein
MSRIKSRKLRLSRDARKLKAFAGRREGVQTHLEGVSLMRRIRERRLRS